MSPEAEKLVNDFGDACVNAAYPRIPAVEAALKQREALFGYIESLEANDRRYKWPLSWMIPEEFDDAVDAAIAAQRDK